MRKESASRGAAVAFFVVISLVPVLVIIIAISGVMYGADAARGALENQLTSILGRPTAILLERAIASASQLSADIYAMAGSVAAIILIASGVFVELEAALNDLFGFKPRGERLPRFIGARFTSFFLVVFLGLLLMVWLVFETGIAAMGDFLVPYLPFSVLLLQAVTSGLSLIVTALLFGVIYRALPARKLSWRHVVYGSLLTTALFMLGRTVLGLYLGNLGAISTLGAGGALMGLLLWVYYSSVIVLFGAAVIATLRSDSPSIRK